MATKNQGLIFKDAEAAKNAIMKSQQKEISKLYKDWADDIGKKAEEYAKKTTSSSVLQERQLKALRKQLTAASKEVANEAYGIIKGNMYITSNMVVNSSKNWLKSLGFGEEAASMMFSNVPDSTVRNIVTGQVYDSGWSLSKAIWSDNEKTLKDIYSIVAKGVAENTGIYDIAKELETYVNPDKKLPWNYKGKDGVKIFKKSVDYNAQRLARTLVQHSYQQSFVAVTKDNPLVKEYKWLSNGSRVCPICKARDGKVYAKDDLPLDHPNGMCTMVPVIDNNMIDNLADWVKNPKKNPELTKFAQKLGYKDLIPKEVVKAAATKKTAKEKTKKIPQFTGVQKKYLEKYGYSTDNMPKSFNKWLSELSEEDFKAAKNWSVKEGKGLKQLFDEKLAKVKYKTVKVTDDTVEEVVEKATGNAAKSQKVQAFSNVQEKYLRPYGFTKNKMPLDFDDWSHKLSYEQGSEILKGMGTDWGDPHPYQQLMKFYNQHLTSESFVSKAVMESSKITKVAKKTGKQFDSTKWSEKFNKNNLKKMETWTDDWLKTISPLERDGVETYTGSAYRNMNRFLRGMSSFTDYEEEIEQATAALKKASLPKETIVRRGANYNILKELGVDISETNKDKFIGAIVSDKGFLSTSPDPDGGFTSSIEYIIKVPKGSQAMYVDTISRHKGEKELLINRGGKFIIEDVEFNSLGNVRRLYMTLKNLKSSK